MEKTNSEYEKKSPFSVDTRIRKYQVRKLSITTAHDFWCIFVQHEYCISHSLIQEYSGLAIWQLISLFQHVVNRIMLGLMSCADFSRSACILSSVLWCCWMRAGAPGLLRMCFWYPERFCFGTPSPTWNDSGKRWTVEQKLNVVVDSGTCST